MKQLVVLGGGESGLGAAILGIKKGYKVWLSDAGNITTEVKDTLNEYGIDWEEQQHTEDNILKGVLVVKSPGIPDEIAIVTKILAAGIPLISDVEFASWHTKAKLVAITGSNGKTTTAHLTYEVLKKAGYDVGLVGNVGLSFCKEVALNDRDYFVVEVSSFQLDHIKKFKPKVSIITNITPDHLDRYGNSFESYINAKMNLAKYQDETDYVVYDQDDPILSSFFQDVISVNKRPFSVNNQTLPGGYYDSASDQLVTQATDEVAPLSINASELLLKGQHNIKNYMAAAIVGSIFKISNHHIREGLALFKGVAHRMEHVATINNIKYINDSKATNVNSVYYALDAIKKPIIWIVGGKDKGNDYTQLNELVVNKVRAIICLGKDNEKLLDYFSNKVEEIYSTQDVNFAVATAHNLAESGDTVLLSPACASFDLFNNYEHRGNAFKEAVNKL